MDGEWGLRGLIFENSFLDQDYHRLEAGGTTGGLGGLWRLGGRGVGDYFFKTHF